MDPTYSHDIWILYHYKYKRKVIYNQKNINSWPIEVKTKGSSFLLYYVLCYDLFSLRAQLFFSSAYYNAMCVCVYYYSTHRQVETRYAHWAWESKKASERHAGRHWILTTLAVRDTLMQSPSQWNNNAHSSRQAPFTQSIEGPWHRTTAPGACLPPCLRCFA